MSIAFTEIPEDMDVATLISEKHKRLFAMGLDERHFDVVAGHFVATLKHLGVKQAEIDEAVGIIGPLRPVFVEAAIEAKKEKQKKVLFRGAALVALIAAGAYAYMEKYKTESSE